MPGSLVALLDRESHLALLARFAAGEPNRRIVVASSHADVLGAATRAAFETAPIAIDENHRRIVVDGIRTDADRVEVRSSDDNAGRFLEDWIRQVLNNDEAIMSRSPRFFELLFQNHGASGIVTVNRLYRNFRRHLCGFVLAAKRLGLAQIDIVAGGGSGWNAPSLQPGADADRYVVDRESLRDEVMKLGIPPFRVEALPATAP